MSLCIFLETLANYLQELCREEERDTRYLPPFSGATSLASVAAIQVKGQCREIIFIEYCIQRINTVCSLIYMSSYLPPVCFFENLPRVDCLSFCLPDSHFIWTTVFLSCAFHSTCLSSALAACQFACIPVCLAIYSICLTCYYFDDRQYVYSMYNIVHVLYNIYTLLT
jgi:hypothetical protein